MGYRQSGFNPLHFSKQSKMKITKAFLLLVIAGLLSCSDSSTGQKVEEKSNDQNSQTSSKDGILGGSTIFHHHVFFNVKSTESIKPLIEQIKTLSEIPEIHNLEYGTFYDLDDKRAMAEFEVFMQMRFKNKEDFLTYQSHPIHLAVKENCKNLLAAPPSTYDFTPE